MITMPTPDQLRRARDVCERLDATTSALFTAKNGKGAMAVLAVATKLRQHGLEVAGPQDDVELEELITHARSLIEK